MPLYMRLRTQEVCSRLDAACYECASAGWEQTTICCIPSKEAVAVLKHLPGRRLVRWTVSGDASSGVKGRGKEEERL